MDLNGTFTGVVEDNKDPEKLGRLKVRVPQVFGAVGGVFGAITTDNIPWALPAGLPNGLSQQSGGADWLPEVGDQVLVRFIDGEPEKPVYEWFMQTQLGVQNFPLHAYQVGPSGSVGKPKRGAWVRYGHTVEWNTDGLIMTTSKGYRMLLTDASPVGNDGDITISTQAGQFLEFDDSVNTVSLNVNEDFYINVGKQMLAICDSISMQTQTDEIELISGSFASVTTKKNFQHTVGQDWLANVVRNASLTTGGDWTVKVTGNANLSVTEAFALAVTGQAGITSELDLTLKSPAFIKLQFDRLFLGDGAGEPYVRGNQLFQYLQALYSILVSHVHPGVQGGSSSTSPMTPTPPAPTPALLSTVITGL